MAECIPNPTRALRHLLLEQTERSELHDLNGYGRRWSVSPPPAPGGHTSIATTADAG